MRRNLDGTPTIDPYVAKELDAGQERARRRTMTPGQRKKADRDAARNRRMIDIDPGLDAKLVNIAADLSVPISQLINYLIIRGLFIVTKEEIEGARQPGRSMRYDFNLIMPEGNP
jgi:hypothetical protein